MENDFVVLKHLKVKLKQNRKPKLIVVEPRKIGIKAEILEFAKNNRLKLFEFLQKEKLTAGRLRQLRIPCIVLRKAGLSVKQLHTLGYTLAEVLSTGRIVGMSLDVRELREAGYPIEDFVSAGIQLYHIVYAGFKAPELRSIGITAKRLQDAKFSNDALLKLGFTEKELK